MNFHSGFLSRFHFKKLVIDMTVKFKLNPEDKYKFVIHSKCSSIGLSSETEA